MAIRSDVLEFVEATKPTDFPKLMITPGGNILLMRNLSSGIILRSNNPWIVLGTVYTDLPIKSVEKYKQFHGAVAISNPKE